MKTSIVSIKIDPKVKKEASKIAEDLGFSLSAIIYASLKNLTRTKTVFYSLFEPTPFLKQAIRSARTDRVRRKSIGPFASARDMVRSLRS